MPLHRSLNAARPVAVTLAAAAAALVAACDGNDPSADGAPEAAGKDNGSETTARAEVPKPTKCGRIKQEALGGRVTRVRAYNLRCRIADRVALPFVERDRRAEGWTYANLAGCEWFAFRLEDAKQLGRKPRRLAPGSRRTLRAGLPTVQFGRYSGCRS